MARSMTLTVTFQGAFGFLFSDGGVSVHSPVCNGHSGYLETNFGLTALAQGAYEVKIPGLKKAVARTVCHNPSDILTVDSSKCSGPGTACYWQIKLPRPDEVVGMYKDPAEVLDGTGKPAAGAPADPATALRFYYEDFDPAVGVNLTGATVAAVSDSHPPACEREFAITFHYQGPPPDGTDDDARNCFQQMMRLFPPFDTWTMGKPAKGPVQTRVTLTHDCKTPVLAVTPGAKIG